MFCFVLFNYFLFCYFSCLRMGAHSSIYHLLLLRKKKKIRKKMCIRWSVFTNKFFCACGCVYASLTRYKFKNDLFLIRLNKRFASSFILKILFKLFIFNWSRDCRLFLIIGTWRRIKKKIIKKKENKNCCQSNYSLFSFAVSSLVIEEKSN